MEQATPRPPHVTQSLCTCSARSKHQADQRPLEEYFLERGPQETHAGATEISVKMPPEELPVSARTTHDLETLPPRAGGPADLLPEAASLAGRVAWETIGLHGRELALSFLRRIKRSTYDLKMPRWLPIPAIACPTDGPGHARLPDLRPGVKYRGDTKDLLFLLRFGHRNVTLWLPASDALEVIHKK